MDPISLASAAVTLVKASASVTLLLANFIEAVKSAEDRVKSLHDEVKTFTAFLTTIEEQLKKCQAPDMTDISSELWQRINFTLRDCHPLLDDLHVLVKKIQHPTRSKRFGWKWRVARQLNKGAADIDRFRSKIWESSETIKMFLGVMTASISLKIQASQKLTHRSLDEARRSFDDLRRDLDKHQSPASEADSSPNETDNSQAGVYGEVEHAPESNCREARNLRAYIASMRRSSDVARAARDAEYEMLERERVHYSGRRSSGPESPRPDASPCGTPRTLRSPEDPPFPGNHYETTSNEGSGDEIEDDFDESLRNLARKRMRDHDHAAVIALLSRESDTQPTSSRSHHSVHWSKVHLAISHLSLGNLRDAERVVLSFPRDSLSNDLAATTMLHAIAVGHLHDNALDEAARLCRLALEGCRRQYMISRGFRWKWDGHYSETIGLLATICEKKNDHVAAQVYRNWPHPNFVYKRPTSWISYLAGHCTFLEEIVNDDLPWLHPAERSLDTDPAGVCELSADAPGTNRGRRQHDQSASDECSSALRSRGDNGGGASNDDSLSDIDSAIGMDNASTRSKSPASSLQRASRIFRPGGRPRQESPVGLPGHNTREPSPIPTIRPQTAT